jgi:hypothetical protein
MLELVGEKLMNIIDGMVNLAESVVAGIGHIPRLFMGKARHIHSDSNSTLLNAGNIESFIHPGPRGKIKGRHSP